MPSPSSHPYGLTVDDITSQYGAATATIQNSEARTTTTTSEREDALEYFIKFPKSSIESDLVLDNANTVDNVPIVILLGWAGCQDRYLMKYSKIYEERG